MKPFRKLLRFWIAFASIISFLLGWVILAHSPKPVAAQSPTSQSPETLQNLPPIQAFGSAGNNNSNGLNFFSNTGPSNTQPGAGVPMLRTRGS
jgi:hypothetical protein